jgi:hypothetical protein
MVCNSPRSEFQFSDGLSLDYDEISASQWRPMMKSSRKENPTNQEIETLKNRYLLKIFPFKF